MASSSESPKTDGDHKAMGTSTNNESRKRSAEPATERRVPLACHRCRTKRARCSGDKPVCAACAKADEECIWPSGRKRKRTRKEMEEEERRERQVALGQTTIGGVRQVIPTQLFAYTTSTRDSLSWVSVIVTFIICFSNDLNIRVRRR